MFPSASGILKGQHPSKSCPKHPRASVATRELGSENSFAHGFPALKVSLVSPTRLECQPRLYYLHDPV